ncbi:MAG: cardiolipin synthase [Pseudomonadota bacterium]
MFTAIIGLLATLVVLSGIACAFRAAQTARTPQGAVGWVVFLLSAPYVAVPLYLILGHHRFRGYVISRRESHRVLAALKVFATRFAPEPGATDVDLAPFEKIARLPAAGGNGVDLLIDGAQAFPAMFEAIDAAQSYVLIQFYIFRDDDLGRELRDHLVSATKRGVHVRMMMDSVGSYGLSRGYIDSMREAGIEVIDRRSSRGPRLPFQINFRNHRKTVVVDGKTGFTGGLNVGDEYMGRSARFGPWRDTHIRLHGPLVTQLQLIFAEDWHWATGQTLQDALFWSPERVDDDVTGLIVATGPADGVESGSLLFFSAIAEAQERICIASPYFVPDQDVATALAHAAMRGVDVRILVPDVVDHRLPWLAAFAYFDRVRAAGVRVFRYGPGFMHQKVFVIDDRIAAIGTTNLDNRSFRLNFEAMAVFFDADVAGHVQEMLRIDLEGATEMDRTLAEQPLWIRYGAPLARLFSPLL